MAGKLIAAAHPYVGHFEAVRQAAMAGVRRAAEQETVLFGTELLGRRIYYGRELRPDADGLQAVRDRWERGLALRRPAAKCRDGSASAVPLA